MCMWTVDRGICSERKGGIQDEKVINWYSVHRLTGLCDGENVRGSWWG